MNGPRRTTKILTPVIWALVVAYFLVDAIFVAIFRPLAKWFEKVPAFLRIATWIESLGPYQSLFLFVVPLLVLEPVKPVGLYLIGTGRPAAGVLFLIVGEAVKILVLERLFHATRPKLMSFRAFAWVYHRVIRIFSYFRSLHVWKSARKWFEEIKILARLPVWEQR
jgi:hypothetical protein